MQTGSPSSRPEKSWQNVGPPPKGIEKIADLKRRRDMFSKRHKCILKKATELNERTGVPVAVIMFSPAGKPKYFGKPSVEEVFSMYLSGDRCMMPPKETETIADRKRRCNTFSKRCPTILKKAAELNILTGAPVAVITFCPSGMPRSFGEPSVEEVFSMYLSGDRCMMPPKGTETVADQKRRSHMFSKRHRCILKKATELNILTGAPVAVIMFSPAGKLKYFGKPSVREVFSKYLSGDRCMMLSKGTETIADRKRRSDMFSKRHRCILKKANELNILTGAPVAVIMFSPAGKLKHFGSPSVEHVFSKYLLEYLPEDEERPALITKYEEARLHKKLENMENKPSVNAGAGAGRDFEFLKNDEINSLEKVLTKKNSLEKDFETSHPPLLFFPVDGDDCRNLSTSPVDLECLGPDLNDFILFEDKDLLTWQWNSPDGCVTTGEESSRDDEHFFAELESLDVYQEI